MTEQVVLEIKNLSKYYGKLLAVNNVNISVETGTVYGFLGPNGAGKTTTIRIILSILKPSSG
jgi:ABC-type multidrug transport system ATPase subunit